MTTPRAAFSEAYLAKTKMELAVNEPGNDVREGRALLPVSLTGTV
jgi:hypothetical protein